MLIEKHIRAIWSDFSDVLIFAGEGAVKRHPEYPAAKTGDVGAAKRLAADLISAAAIASVARLVGSRDTMLLPVHALDWLVLVEKVASATRPKIGVTFHARSQNS